MVVLIYGICNLQGVCYECEGVRVPLGETEGDQEADEVSLGEVNRSRQVLVSEAEGVRIQAEKVLVGEAVAAQQTN